MAFQLSPGVLVTEKDLTGIVPAVATSIGGYVGAFQWGPVEEITSISNEADLVRMFGKPNDAVATSFFSAANFLSYSNNLKIVRMVGAGAFNAITGAGTQIIKNMTAWEQLTVALTPDMQWAAKYPGELGNSLKVSVCDASGFDSWAYKANFTAAPGTSAYVDSLGKTNDEMHVVVIDEDGAWTGTAGTVLETFGFLSKALDAKTYDGSSAYYKEVIKKRSKYVWVLADPDETNWSTVASSITSAFDGLGVFTHSFSNGADGADPGDTVTIGWDLFANTELVDVNLLFNGANTSTAAISMIQDVAEVRRDCIAFVSPFEKPSVKNDVTDALAELGVHSSYGVMDSGWKYQYDKYNDTYRWVPLNADIAGLCARTDNLTDPWFSPAGLNRGQIKNVTKLAYSPNKADRDDLYVAGINPVITLPGQGTVLYGDKTLLAKPSAFDRINVRRLFIVLEKAIATAGKFQLFEFNDAFTRAQFRNLVEPFLRDVQGRRGIYDFKVICDETNNTGEIIDSNSFVADIYIKPARSINFMQLNFIATRTGVSFSEVVGA